MTTIALVLHGLPYARTSRRPASFLFQAHASLFTLYSDCNNKIRSTVSPYGLFGTHSILRSSLFNFLPTRREFCRTSTNGMAARRIRATRARTNTRADVCTVWHGTIRFWKEGINNNDFSARSSPLPFRHFKMVLPFPILLLYFPFWECRIRKSKNDGTKNKSQPSKSI